MLKTDMKKLTSLNKFVVDEIDTRLVKFFDQKITAAKQIDPIYGKLLEDMKKFILRGGKRLRPTLMLLGYRAGGGKDIKKALDIALSLEIFHNFVLIHDDVMDGDLKRYGGANITGIYNKRFSALLDKSSALHTAESIAILAGELNELFTFEILTELDEDPKRIFDMMRHFNKTLFETGAGQQLDVMSEVRGNLNLSKIEKVNYYKTAQYTITSPLSLGLIASGGNDKLNDQFARFGSELGKAFQLADDLLGMFGSTKQTGKPVGSDIREGKQTLLMFYAKKLCTPGQWRVIQSRFGRDNITSDDVKLVRATLKECGAQAKVAVAANDYLQKSLGVLEEMKLDDEIKELLASFAHYCVQRKK
jgi:geranylgeranyl diphosphate synthase type I